MFPSINKPAFGQAATTTGFGFGTNATPNANPFAQNQSSLFGKPATGFGSPSTSTFGQPQTNSLFPQQQQQQQAPSMFQTAGSTFGAAPTTQSGFGGGLFGQQPSTSGGLFNTTTTFGQQAKPTGFGFGQQQQPQQSQMFGSATPQTGGMFQQQQQPATGGGLFQGFGAQQQQQSGTTVKFNPVTGTDTMVKNGQSQTINTKHHSITCMKEYESKSFEELRWEDYQANRKQPTTAPPMFGQPPAFDQSKQQTGGFFGQPASSATTTGFGGFTAPAGGLFGAPKPATTVATPSFGFPAAQSSVAPTANPFAPQQQQQQQQQQNKPFAPVFGAPTTSQPTFGGGMFGAQQPQQQASIFGKPAQVQVSQTQQTSLFSSQAAKPLFGAAVPTAQANAQSNTFKPFQPTTTGLFAPKTDGIFGQQQPAAQQSLFSTPQMAPSLNFGGGGLTTTMSSTGLMSGGLGLGIGDTQPPNNIAFLTCDPFGDSPHLAGLEPKIKSPDASLATNPTELKNLLDSSKKIDCSHSPRLKLYPKVRRDGLFDGLQVESPEGATGPRKSVRRLLIRPRSPQEDPSILRDEIFGKIEADSVPQQLPVVSPHSTLLISPPKPVKQVEKAPEPLKLVFDLDDEHEDEPVVEKEQPESPFGIINTRPEYFIKPDIEELRQFADPLTGACYVRGFTIGRRGYGNVYFPDEMDVAGLDIDKLVQFRYREINVYPDETLKPPVGQGLNRRAQVTLDKVYPKRTGSDHLITDIGELLQMNFADKLRRVTVKKQAKFVDYRPETGSWVFKVEHFSKYGFNDSDDEQEQQQQQQQQKLFKLPEQRKTIEESIIAAPPQQSQIAFNKLSLMEDELYDDDLLEHSMLVDMHPSPVEKQSSKSVQLMKSVLYSTSMDDEPISEDYLDMGEDLPPIHIPEPEPIKRAILRPRVAKLLCQQQELELPETTRSCMDIQIFKGLSFKASFLHPLVNISRVNTTELSFESLYNQDNEPQVIDCLKAVLQSSDCEYKNGVPTFRIQKGLKYLNKQMDVLRRSEHAQWLQVWSLCAALWGTIPPNQDRRLMLTDWLKLYLQPETGNLFDLLTGFKVFEASNQAMETKHPQLSMIIAQLGLTQRTKGFLQAQIEGWYDSLGSEHISDDLKRIYLLLSGIPSKGEVNVFENLDWLRAFALHLWYIVPNAATIETALEAYRLAFDEAGYAAEPLSTSGKAHHILYHVLQLYRNGAHRLSTTLNPHTHTSNPLDYRLSWLLLQLFNSLEVGLVNPEENTKINTSFATQLEASGQWQWACFVLLHMEDNLTKKKLIIEVLERNLTPEPADTNFLVNDLKVPPQWIHEVKGYKCEAVQRPLEAFNHLCLAENNHSGELLAKELVPSLFINEQYAAVRMLLERVPGGGAKEAELVGELLDLQEHLESGWRTDEAFRLQARVRSICERLAVFPLDTAQLKLCAAEISKRCAWMCRELGGGLKFLDALIMPPDFKQNEAFCLINDLDHFKLIN